MFNRMSGTCPGGSGEPSVPERRQLNHGRAPRLARTDLVEGLSSAAKERCSMSDVVAANYDNYVTNDPYKIECLAAIGIHPRWITRDEAARMAKIFGSPQWAGLSKSPALAHAGGQGE